MRRNWRHWRGDGNGRRPARGSSSKSSVNPVSASRGLSMNSAFASPKRPTHGSNGHRRNCYRTRLCILLRIGAGNVSRAKRSLPNSKPRWHKRSSIPPSTRRYWRRLWTFRRPPVAGRSSRRTSCAAGAQADGRVAGLTAGRDQGTPKGKTPSHVMVTLTMFKPDTTPVTSAPRM